MCRGGDAQRVKQSDAATENGEQMEVGVTLQVQEEQVLG